MGKNEKRILITALIVLAAFSVIAFVPPFTKNALFFVSYGFGVLAILLQLLAMKIAFKDGESAKSKFYGFPIARISIVYMAVQVVLSIVFIVLDTVAPTWIAVISYVFIGGTIGGLGGPPTWIAVVAYVVIIAVSLVGFIAADATRDEIVRQDTLQKANTSCMNNLRSIVYSLPNQIEDAECSKMLGALADEFRYSDPVSSDAIMDAEEELKVLVSELQRTVIEGEIYNVKVMCKKTKAALAERNRVCKLNK